MSDHEKIFENTLRLALVKERLHSYSVSRGHGSGKTAAIKGASEILFFGLADFIRMYPELRRILGKANSTMLYTSLYGTMSEKEGIRKIVDVIHEAANSSAPHVFEHLNKWVTAYSTVLDLIPTFHAYMQRAELKNVRDHRMTPAEVIAIGRVGQLMNTKEFDRFARFTNSQIRGDRRLEQHLVSGFPLSMNIVINAPTDEQFEELARTCKQLDTYLKLYQRIATQATGRQPAPSPLRRRY